MTKKQFVKGAAFLIVLIMVFYRVSDVFCARAFYTEQAKMVFGGMYELPKNTEDVVIIGNSHVFSYWQGPYAWDQFGMTATVTSTADMPGCIFKNMAIEVMKRQKPKVIVFEVTGFTNLDKENERVHLALNHMKPSLNHIDAANAYCETQGIEGFDRLPYYFQILAFHGRWKELVKGDFVQSFPSYLNGLYQGFYWKQQGEVFEHTYTEARAEVGEEQIKALDDLLEWCSQQKDVQFEFVAVPSYYDGHERNERINYVMDIINEAGFNTINYNEMDLFEQFDFDCAADFWDEYANHTNINGSFKFVQIYGQYLVDTYGIEDHRGDSAYEYYETLSRKYFKKIGPNFLYKDRVQGTYDFGENK